MRVAWLRGAGDMELGEVELPAPEGDELLLEVVACGICGSNLHDWHRPNPAVTAMPGAFGHEISARVLEPGPTATLARGDVVVVDPSAIRACGTCEACLEGADWFCARKGTARAYGFADQVLVPERAVYRVPAGVDPVLAALAEPFAVGVHGLRHSWTAREHGRLDDRHVVVLGAGMVGLASVAAARWLGASGVTVVARHPHQAAAARALGADEVLGSDDEGLSSALRRRRAPLVVEAVGGSAGTLALAASVVAWRGEVVCLGAFDGPQALDVGSMMNREIRLYCAVAYAAREHTHDLQVALDLMAGAGVDLSSLVTHRFALADVAGAFATADDKRSGAIRVVVQPGLG